MLQNTAAHAATLFVTPEQTTITPGKNFSVSIRVNSEGRPINVATAVLTYPSDLLEQVGVSSGSTFSIQTPGSPSVQVGKIGFSAGITAPGYAGTNGVLGRITFKAKKAGTAVLDIASGELLLNDGNATNAMSGKKDAIVTITNQPAVEKKIVPVEKVIPQPQESSIPTTESTITDTGIDPVPLQSLEESQTDIFGPVSTTVTKHADKPLSAVITITISNVILFIYVLVGTVLVLLVVVILLLVRLLMVRSYRSVRKTLPKDLLLIRSKKQ